MSVDYLHNKDSSTKCVTYNFKMQYLQLQNEIVSTTTTAGLILLTLHHPAHLPHAPPTPQVQGADEGRGPGRGPQGAVPGAAPDL